MRRSVDAASDGEENSRDDDNKSIGDDEEFTAFQWDLQSKNWYWGNVSKDVLAIAMQNHPTGTFAVRDASTPGDYTLTIRINDTQKLIRVYVINNKVGFTLEHLDFDSVVDLVEHYRNCSLEDHNSALKTSLKFPLVRSRHAESPMPPNDEDEIDDAVSSSELDRVPKKLANMRREGSKYDSERQATTFVLHHFLEGVIAEMVRAERRHEQIVTQVDSLESEYKKHKSALQGYENALKLLKDNRTVLQKSMDSVDNNTTRETVSTNKTLQDKRIKSLKEMKNRLRISLEGIERIKDGLTLEDSIMLKRAKIIKDRCERYSTELRSYGIDKYFMDHKTNDIQMTVGKESDKLLQNLLKVNLVTSPFDWLTKNSEKKYANDLVQKSLSLLKKRGVRNTNGLFMIRPSSSKASCFALVIAMNEIIYNCLIEYKEPKTSKDVCGYAFLNTNLFYTTLADFIRYYSLVTLREHNDNLDTVLRIPVLKYLSSVRKRQQNDGTPIDEEEAQLISGLKMDLADIYTFDDIDPDLQFT